ncbi:hypothetical protein GCM10017673_24910 [Streptosporangium violaceochromogenes]|nr:hypothetical protein GCM10017673_24910 [Streptosporangium violaceochromogenes]
MRDFKGMARMCGSSHQVMCDIALVPDVHVKSRNKTVNVHTSFLVLRRENVKGTPGKGGALRRRFYVYQRYRRSRFDRQRDGLTVTVWTEV